MGRIVSCPDNSAKKEKKKKKENPRRKTKRPWKQNNLKVLRDHSSTLLIIDVERRLKHRI